MQKQLKIGYTLSVLVALGFILFVIYGPGKNKDVGDPTIITEKQPEGLLLADAQKIQLEIPLVDKRIAEATNDDEKYDALVDKAKLIRRLGRLGDAKKLLDQALKLYPERVSGLLEMFELQIEMNDIAGATESIKIIVRENSSSAYWRMYIDFEKDKLMANPGRLHELYVEALQKTDEHVSLVVAFARFLEMTGDLQVAKEYWQKAIVKDPENKAEYEVEVKRLDALISSQK